MLTYSDNKAKINSRKGKDYGIDGKAHIVEILDGKNRYKDVLFSVKSGKVSPAMIRDFRGVLE